MAQVAIRTEKLVHTYPRGNVMALKGVDLEIYVGDILSIVGLNINTDAMVTIFFVV